ncbi:MAG TPA: polyprenyl synthetase family protein, partial [Thermoleophilaceae bacterium]
LEQTETLLAKVTANHGARFAQHAGDTLAAGGKRLRPMLVFLCASGAARADALATRADVVPADLLRAAAAVELLHMASLVHDDVLDRAALRRGRPTVFAAGGRQLATASGDFLFARAFAELAASGDAAALRALSDAASALVRGELMQRADAWSADVTSARYLERCRLKTGSLFEASCRLGVLLGGDPQLAAALGNFGGQVGLAFQLLDDVLDIAGPTERTGKPRGADLLDGTVTLPLIIARKHDSRLRDLRSAVTDAASAAAACARIEATGALVEARTQALELVAAAKASLRALELPDRRGRALELVADGVVDRYA